jgi:hypothetical protein
LEARSVEVPNAIMLSGTDLDWLMLAEPPQSAKRNPADRVCVGNCQLQRDVVARVDRIDEFSKAVGQRRGRVRRWRPTLKHREFAAPALD